MNTKEELAKLILDHPALDALREQIQNNIFQKFRTATMVEREILSAIMDCEHLLFRELKVLSNENKKVNG